MSYVDKSYYIDVFKGNMIDENDIDKSLRKASRHIDTLTFNRVNGLGFENLTDFQKDIITLNDKTELKVSRSKKKEVKQALLDYYKGGLR